ncbi:MAG: SUMF1/EgtB/PvdO family nonheme iron enzyme [Bacteroidales bacterium]|nr:SUMF1/EgtB/PvdO family nonheme iron enzyme [Bacteroidales bacterium]
MKVYTLFALLFVLVFSFEVSANNVLVENVNRAGANRNIVDFDLSWENSWYFNNIPNNHDAVWIFVKFRECGGGGAWHHALLSTTMGDHSFDTDITYAKSISANDRFGSPGNHNTGVLVKRSTIGKGDIVSQAISLQIVGSTDGTAMADTAEYDIRVFAIEMVQIPQGRFYVGDGTSTSVLFTPGTGYGTSYGYIPYDITSETHNDTINYGYYGYPVELNSTFPKGYDEFYMMKYEITQGQYVDFLNTISPIWALNRAYIVNSYNIYIYLNGEYMTSHSDRAMGYLSYDDYLSYLDWAALRPMTELEFEKACRGPKDFSPGEYAWGNNVIIEARNITYTTPGTELCTDSGANMHYYGADYYLHGGVFGVNGYGPVEVGIFARDTTLSREATGGSYYGAMEMSGNVREFCVQINTNNGNPATTTQYSGIWGDGVLDAFGNYNATDWPVSGEYYLMKSGYWHDNQDRCRVSDRNNKNNTNYTTRNYYMGGRGVR